MTIIIYSFQKAKRLDLQSRSSLKVLNIANNTFISDFKSSQSQEALSCFPMHLTSIKLLGNYIFFNFSSQSFHLAKNNCTLNERGPPLQACEPGLLDCTTFPSSRPSLCLPCRHQIRSTDLLIPSFYTSFHEGMSLLSPSTTGHLRQA